MSLRSNGAKVYVIRDKEHRLSSPPPAQAATSLLIGSIEKTDHRSFTAKGQFHPVSDTFLLEHTLGGSPILPMVVTMECFLEAISMAKETFRLTEVSLEDLKIHQGFKFRIKKSFDYYIVGKEESAPGNAVSLALHGDFYNVQGQRIKTDKLYASAVVRFNGQHKGTNLNLTPISNEWRDMIYSDDLPIFHGASFRCLQQFHSISERRAITTVHVPDSMDVFSGRKADTEPVLNAVIVDAALFSCGVLHWKTMRQGVCIPSTIQKIVFGSGRLQKGETAQIHIERGIADTAGRESGGDGKQVVFNFTIRNSKGEVVYDVEGYTAIVLKTPTRTFEPVKI
ncbi:MAG: polyketide synthase dehydratase domain-containing protein [Planctomycetaceae bacterium]|nr:polyketide synthase dehydratase domain-containing protein [Planctomycetaceae bacterium]